MESCHSNFAEGGKPAPHGMGIKKLYKFWRFLYCIEFYGAAGRHSGCRESALHIRIEEIEKFPSMLLENVARGDFSKLFECKNVISSNRSKIFLLLRPYFS